MSDSQREKRDSKIGRSNRKREGRHRDGAPALATWPRPTAEGFLRSRDALPRLPSSLDGPHAEGTGTEGWGGAATPAGGGAGQGTRPRCLRGPHAQGRPRRGSRPSILVAPDIVTYKKERRASRVSPSGTQLLRPREGPGWRRRARRLCYVSKVTLESAGEGGRLALGPSPEGGRELSVPPTLQGGERGRG